MNEATGYWKLVEPYCNCVSIYDGPTVFLREFKAAPEPSRNLLATHWCQSEVCNGGFDQFFCNSTGVLAPEAVQGFRAIGMDKAASVVQRATELLGTEYPRDREIRNQKVGALRESSHSRVFQALDEEFFKLLAMENGGWDAAADRYAANHGG